MNAKVAYKGHVLIENQRKAAALHEFRKNYRAPDGRKLSYKEAGETMMRLLTIRRQPEQ